MYTVYRKTFGIDEDMCETDDIDYFETEREAERYARDLTECYANPEWDGHKYYNAKFYAYKISEDTIRHKQYQYALWQASMA